MRIKICYLSGELNLLTAKKCNPEESFAEVIGILNFSE